MKPHSKALFALLFFAVSMVTTAEDCTPFAQDIKPTVTFRESYIDILRWYSEPGYSEFYLSSRTRMGKPVGVGDALVLKASASGLNTATFGASTPFEFSIGDLSWEGTLGEGVKTTVNGFPLYTISISDYDNYTLEDFDAGDLTITWDNSKVTVKFIGSFQNYFIASYDWIGTEEEEIYDVIPVSFGVAGHCVETLNCYITGRSWFTEETDSEDSTWDISHVVLSGESDTTKPTIKINSPANNATVFQDKLTVGGDADDNYTVDTVYWRVNGGDWHVAGGDYYWSASKIPLSPDTNTIECYAVDEEGNESNIVKRTVIYSLVSPLAVKVTGNGTVTQDYAGTTNQTAGKEITIKATPAEGWVFKGWSGRITSSDQALTFIMEPEMNLTANFAPGPFILAAGKYNGLVVPPSPVLTASGFMKIAVSDTGLLKGRLQIGKRVYKLEGSFDGTGNFKKSFPATNKPPTELTLHMDTENFNDVITGTVKNDKGVTSNITLHHRVWNEIDNPSPKAGAYTMVFAPDAANTDSTVPQGSGYGVVTVSTAGKAKLSGKLADGTPILHKAYLSKDNKWPLYQLLNDGRGYILGEITFRDQAGVSDFDGVLDWQRKKDPLARKFGAGFKTRVNALGSAYAAPADGARVFPSNSEDGVVQLTDGGLKTNPLEKEVTISTSNIVHVTSPGPDALSLTISTTDGLFSGTFVEDGKTLKLRGAILQKQNAGAGYFLNGQQSGQAVFTAP